jgi:predicted acylesterase/phospholipase RssA
MNSFPIRSLLILATTLAGAASCSFSASDAMKKLASVPAGPSTPTSALQDQIARTTKETLQDSYYEPTSLRKILWDNHLLPVPHIDGDFANGLVIKLRDCLKKADAKTSPWVTCDDVLKKAMKSLGDSPKDHSDASRVLANVVRLTTMIRYAIESFGDDPTDASGRDRLVEQGVRMGAQQAVDYIERRTWKRNEGRHNFAMVISGGSANGAFAAGIVYRMLMIAHQCELDSVCARAPYPDVAIGTSTGTLIDTLIDQFASDKDDEDSAMVNLLNYYTCSVDSDLYCIDDANVVYTDLLKFDSNITWPIDFNTSVTGLVRFNGIAEGLHNTVSQRMIDNKMELIATVVDYQSGLILSQSDQDPNSFDVRTGLTPEYEAQSILASIVLPVYAEPTTWVPSPNGCRKGAFYDGGVRMGIALKTAVTRGADRAFVISNDNGVPDLSTVGSPGNVDMGTTLFRSLDLFTYQTLLGQVEGAEYEARFRRMLEQDLCAHLSGKTSPEDLTAFGCATSDASAVVTEWKSTWVFIPNELATLVEYDFEPGPMQNLFQGAVRVIQPAADPKGGPLRAKPACIALMDYLGIPPEYGKRKCEEPADAVLAQIQMPNAKTCAAHQPKTKNNLCSGPPPAPNPKCQ